MTIDLDGAFMFLTILFFASFIFVLGICFYQAGYIKASKKKLVLDHPVIAMDELGSPVTIAEGSTVKILSKVNRSNMIVKILDEYEHPEDTTEMMFAHKGAQVIATESQLRAVNA